MAMLSVVGVLPAALVAWTCYLETHYPLWDQPAADTNLTKCGPNFKLSPASTCLHILIRLKTNEIQVF